MSTKPFKLSHHSEKTNNVDKTPPFVAEYHWALTFYMNTRTHSQILPQKKEYHEILNKVSHSIAIAGAINECLWLGDKNHRTIYVNPVYERTTGYSLQECIGQPSDFCFDEESKRIIAEQHKLRKKGVNSQYEATIVTKTGEHVPMLISGSPTTMGGTIGIFINLTKIKELTKQDKIAQQIMQNSEEAFVILSADRKIKLWNTGARKIFGFKENEALEKIIDIIIPQEESDHNRSLINEVENKGYIKNVETKRMRKDGSLVDVSISVSKVMDDHKKLIGYLVIYRDITQQKYNNNELQKRFEAIQDAYKELGLQKRQLDYVYEIVNAATSKDSLENLENLIVSALCMLTKCDGVVMRKYDKTRNTLRLKSGFGINKQWWDKSQIQFENSIAEQAFKKKRALIIDNIDSYKKHQGTPLLRTHKFKTLVLLPLIINNKLLGTISLYATDPAKFRFIETDFLENIGKQCALAIFAKSPATK